MMLRAAIRYSEYRAADKLSSAATFDCKTCMEKGLQDRRNCDGEKTNPNFKVVIGSMQFDQCPLAIPSQEARTVVQLILTSEETNIPIVGTCLLDQTQVFFDYRGIINDERFECQKELSKVRERDAKVQQRNAENRQATGRVRR